MDDRVRCGLILLWAVVAGSSPAATVTNGFSIEHEYSVETFSNPVVWRAQIQLRRQPSAANGGAYIDSFQVRTTTTAYASRTKVRRLMYMKTEILSYEKNKEPDYEA